MERNMDTTKCLARSDASNITTAQESQWNLQIFTPIIKQEPVHFDEEELPQYTDEDKTFCNEYMSLCKPLQTSDCVNYVGSKIHIVLEEVKKEFSEDEYPQPDHNRSSNLDLESPCKPLKTSDCVDNSDCKFYVLKELKKEFPENECLQPVHNRNSSLVFENEELSRVIERQDFKQEHTADSLSLIKNEEIREKEYPFIVKIESLEENRVLDNFGDSGTHYDVLITPQQVQCKLCDRTFNNRYTLLIHNNEHINIVINPTLVDMVMNELHKCKCCDEHFNSHDNMLAHVRDVHSNERHKPELYHKSIKPYLTRKNGKKMKYKCDLCERVYKNKHGLVEHIKKIHVDYGRMFECWCGKQFRTPIYLSRHKRRQHNPNDKNIVDKQFQCDYCHKIFKIKRRLACHVMRVHHHYGKIFECPCGKQFRTPHSLSEHKKRQHILSDEIIEYNQQYQCDFCHIFFKSKFYLICHIRSVHYDHGTIFKCSCGEQFRTPLHLYQHNQQMHRADGLNTNNDIFQCHICQKLVKKKKYLSTHIKSAHYDYGKTFDCWCGKEFRTPEDLRRHQCRIHSSKREGRLQCDSCEKFFRNESNLMSHIKHVHYDYGKVFTCWCGEQFSEPILLCRHERQQHINTNIAEFKAQLRCVICERLFKTKRKLGLHMKEYAS